MPSLLYCCSSLPAHLWHCTLLYFLISVSVGGLRRHKNGQLSRLAHKDRISKSMDQQIASFYLT